MKIGIIFESQSELTKRIPIDFIATTWRDGDTYKSLQCTAKIRLQRAGYDESSVNELSPLIRKAKRWALKNKMPKKTVIPENELSMWNRLTEITTIIANI